MKKLVLLVVVGVIFTACYPNDPLANHKCASNEILYISKTCIPIELGTYDGWGANITSNTYDNGVGRLKFDTEVTTIPNGAFQGSHLLRNIKLSNTIISVGDFAFYGCRSLLSVAIDNGITSIGDYAFCGCESLINISIPNSVTSIEDGVFCKCSSLANITIPDSVNSIGEEAFYGCTSLTSVTIPDSVTSIGKFAFLWCNSLVSMSFQGTTPPSVGDGVFDNFKINVPKAALDAYALSDWSLKDKIKIVGFRIPANHVITYTSSDGCKIKVNGDYSAHILGSLDLLSHTYGNGVGELVFSDVVTDIMASAFSGCNNLKTIIIPNSVTSIGYNAFFGCTSLASITIPDSVTSIGSSAFYGCSSLTIVYCKSMIPPIGGNRMFYDNASGRKIYVPRNSVSAYKSAEYWSDYASYIVGYDF